MKQNALTKHLSGVATMVGGSFLVIGAVLLVNRFAQGPDKQDLEADRQVTFERKEQPPPPPKPKEQPQPRQQRNTRQAPSPLVGLDTALSGLDVGIPAFSTEDLNSLGSDLLNAEGGVMTDDTVDQPPQPTFRAPMQYPPSARARGIEGYVVLSLLIGVTGEVQNVKVVESEPQGMFEEVAQQGVQQWEFQPARYNGQAVRAWAKQRVRFNLSG